MGKAPRRDAVLQLSPGCDLGCPLCERGPARTLEGGGGGGRCLTIRGRGDALAAIARARAAGWQRVRVHAHAPSAIDGADALLVPIASHVGLVHERITGQPLDQALAVLERKLDVDIEIEIPILPRRLSHPLSIVRLARSRARIAGVRLYAPRAPSPAPARWDEGGTLLCEVLDYCGAEELEASVDRGVPFCALRDRPDLAARHLRFDPRRPQRGPVEPPCDACACNEHCRGPSVAYREKHGGAGLAPWRERPEALYAQRTSPARRWTDAEREAARKTKSLLVLRPTVNCNQDCLFCSANETSGNVWTSSDAMLRQIARAARRGVQRVALSGGEPTLDKNLPHYVAAARRLGVPEVELVTNGTLLDRPARVQALAQAGLTHAFVSLHAHDEALSRRITQKRGDFARTVAAIEGLIERGVKTAINHVITSRNYRFLPDFVSFARERFAGRAGISFALVTPQYKALEHLELMPRMRDVRPWLERALERSIAIGQPAWVGSRQGIPPCQLGPHRALSDVLEHPEAARTEDAPQKVKAQVCERCRYRQVCTGVWKPYAARYGLEELVPFEGPPITQAERDEVWARKTEPWGLLSEVPSFLLDPVSAERELASESKLDGDGGGSDPQDYLPIHTRPFRVLLIGTGPRGRAIARTLGEGLALAAVCSPHAVEGDPELGGCPSYRDVHEALEGARPDAVIVAAPAGAHESILRIAIEHACSSRAPILCTRPFESEAMAELAQARGVPLWVAHETLALPWPRGERLEATLCVTGIGAWGRRAIEACVEDALAIAWRVLGPEGAQPIRASFTGDSRPESLRVELARGELTLRFADDGRLARSAPQGTVQGALQGSVQIDGERIALETGVHRLGPALRASLEAGAASTFAAAPEAIRIAQAARRATELCGAPFDRKGAPKHVASAGLR